ncbi:MULTISPECIES: chemotaxis-specific protein-glutamate methyltransferase CheB [unclassified Duganella]|uniref:chemotaxis-specific protein-glutamate methyltransferase CheB n=1 Tax=unclassified Duganella TaxID=2636909 RepID=UPI0006FB50D0|nr:MULTISPECIES: chemotaxis-specific protein-glutamate methyltransferase CheB [unclassified Duganella]KQV46723.1 chemotaxis response regulator CheB [Duganella sp. Root336D2]KRC00954.1 chemotaxis response regulator CheB [Duganella sp. Root198D2]
MKRLRVLVVEDSLTMRRFLCEAVAADPGCELVGEADNGKRAIELCQELRPDVISLDMMLPVMSGLAATEFIMAYVPTPILVVSASTNRGELFKTYEALAAGAVDAIEKPRADEDSASWCAHYIAQLRLIARVRVLTHVRGRLQAGDVAPPRAALPAPASATLPRVAAIGASTGGPRAVVQVLRGIPSGLGLPLLLVIHIGEPFGSAFADWLDGQTRHRVRLARDGEALDPGAVCVAPPGRHLRLRGRRLQLEDGPERHSCKPSVDELFESLARECGAACAAALLTGMGSDGAVGLAAIRAVGGTTIAQDEATSVVYGMPREAARLDAAQRILPLGAIGPALAATVTTGVMA